MNWSNFLMTLLLWGAVHFLADFAFQSSWMATRKIPDDPHKPRPQGDAGPNEVLIYHCLTYTATFVIVDRLIETNASSLAFLIIFLAHVAVDYYKVHKRYVTTIWLDQTLHILTLILLILMGWM